MWPGGGLSPPHSSSVLPSQKDDDMTAATPLTGSPVRGVHDVRLKRSPVVLRRLLTLTALLLGATSLAQPMGLPEIELERLTLNPGATGSLLLGTGELLPSSGYRFSLTGHYENDPLVLFEDEDRLGSVVKHRVTGHLAGAYGLTRRLELSAQAPVLLMQRGDDLTEIGVGRPAGGLSLGTPYVGLRLGILSQRDNAAAVDLAVGLSAGLPVGSAEALARDSSLRVTPNLMVGRNFGPLRAALDAGLLMRPRAIFSDDENVQDEVGNELRLGAVLATTGEGLRGEMDLIAYVPFRREGNSVEALAGLRLPLSGSIEAYALAGAGFDNAPGTPSFRGLLGLAFGRGSPARCVAGGKHTPQQCPHLDDDVDGVPNGPDACPKEGGKVDAQGCPLKDTDTGKDTDKDGDGVLDTEDKCPTEAGPRERQGCPLRDTDKDGIVDEKDSCPTEAGIPELNGCPAKDTDGDKVSDHLDSCPTEAGLPELKGCPQKDTDGDKVFDHLDDCPKTPGLVELKGCPANDRDRDGVLDSVDECPDTKGLVELKGCPEPIIKGCQINLMGNTVYFKTGKSTIDARSYELLDQVLRIIVTNKLEKVLIEGHTDDQGDALKNKQLSEDRANEVMKYFVKKGLEEERLKATGYGEDRPVVEGKTPAARTANRRVEFNLPCKDKQQQQ